MTIDATLEQIYLSLERNNEGLDAHIAALKTQLAAQGINTVEVDTKRLVQGNRQGRRLMQTYFKKRGVIVTFAA
jgi:hypothetical protein